MFNIYIKDFNRNGQVISEEELLQTIPSEKPGDLKLINPTVKIDIGNAESLAFSIEPGTKYYDSFLQMKTYIRIEYDGSNIFYGRVLTVDNDFYGDRKIRCEGALAFFNDSYLEGVKETSRSEKTVKEYIEFLLKNHNDSIQDQKRHFTIGEVPDNYSEVVSEAQRIVGKTRKYGSDSWTDTKSALEDLRSHHGGYFRTRTGTDTDGQFTIFLDWMNYYFNPEYNTQTIEVGINVLDISVSTEVNNIFTVVIPIGTLTYSTSKSGDSDSTKKSSKNELYVDGKEVKVPDICDHFSDEKLNEGYHKKEDYAEAINKYGRIIKTVTFDDAKNKEDLYEKCCEWIRTNYQGEVTKFSVKAIDMHQIGKDAQKIMVGDRVKVIYPVGQEDGSVVKKEIYLTCLSINYDLYGPENNSYTFGIPANILTKTYGVKKQAKSTSTTSSNNKNDDTSTEKQERDWLDEVSEWLLNHLIQYKTGSAEPPPFPFMEDDVHRRYMHGPDGTRSYINKIYNTDKDWLGASGVYSLWWPKLISQSHFDDEYDIDVYMDLLHNSRNHQGAYGDISNAAKLAAQAYRDQHTVSREWSIGSSPDHINHRLTIDDIVSHNIVEYIKDEYGYDLRTGGTVKMPSTIKLNDGTTIETTETTNELGEKEIAISRIFNEGDSEDIHLSPDGRNVLSYRDPETGDWEYYVMGSDGKPHKTSFYSFTMDTIENDRTHAFITKKYFNVPKQKKNPDGSLMFDEWGNPVYETDPDGNIIYEQDENGENILEANAYLFGQSIENYRGGELVVARVEGDKVLIGGNKNRQIVETALNNMSRVCGNFYTEVDDYGNEKVVLRQGSGIYQNIDGMEMGLYHQGNLTAGVVVDLVNGQPDGETRVRIAGDFIEVGTDGTGHVAKTVLSKALESSGQLVGHMEEFSSVDHATGETTTGVRFKADAGIEIARFAIDDDGNFIKDEQGNYLSVYSGLLDDAKLTAGLITSRINGQSVSFITSDHLVLGNASTAENLTKTLTDAGVIVENPNDHTFYAQQLVANTVYANKMVAINAEFTNIKADYLKVTNLNSEIAKITDRVYIGKSGEEQTGLAVRGSLDLSSGTIVNLSNTRFLASGSSGSGLGGSYLASKMIIEASLSTDGLTLTLQPLSGDPINFKKVASVSSNWSDTSLTVTASPTSGDKSYVVSFGTRFTNYPVNGESKSCYEITRTVNGSTTSMSNSQVYCQVGYSNAGTTEDPYANTTYAEIQYATGSNVGTRITNSPRLILTNYWNAAKSEGNAAGYNSAHVTGSWATTTNSFTYSKTTSGSSNSGTIYVAAAISQNKTQSNPNDENYYVYVNQWSSTNTTANIVPNTKKVVTIINDSSNNNIVKLQLDGNDIGYSFVHNKYTAGYNSAHVTGSWSSNVFTYSKTTSGTTNSASLTFGSGVGAKTQDTSGKTYIYATVQSGTQTGSQIGGTYKELTIANDGDNKVVLKVDGTNSSLSYAHNKYTAGYNSAHVTGSWTSNVFKYEKTTSGTTNSATITIDAKVAMQQGECYSYATWLSGSNETSIAGTSKKVTIVNNGDNAVKLQLAGSDVGYSFTHNKYTAGYNTGVNSVGISSVYFNAPSATGYAYDGTTWPGTSTIKGWYVTANLGSTASNGITGSSDGVVLYVQSFADYMYQAGYNQGHSVGWDYCANNKITVSANTSSKTLDYNETVYVAVSVTKSDGTTSSLLSRTYVAPSNSSVIPTPTFNNNQIYATGTISPQLRGSDNQLHNCVDIKTNGKASVYLDDANIVFKMTIGTTEYFYKIAINPYNKNRAD